MYSGNLLEARSGRQRRRSARGEGEREAVHERSASRGGDGFGDTKLGGEEGVLGSEGGAIGRTDELVSEDGGGIEQGAVGDLAVLGGRLLDNLDETERASVRGQTRQDVSALEIDDLGRAKLSLGEAVGSRAGDLAVPNDDNADVGGLLDRLSVREVDVSDVGEDDLVNDPLGDQVRVRRVSSRLLVDLGLVAERGRRGRLLGRGGLGRVEMGVLELRDAVDEDVSGRSSE